MNNTDEILKRILLNMKYDSRKTLSEQGLDDLGDLKTVTVKPGMSNQKTEEGNSGLKNKKIKSCVDGEEIVSPNFSEVVQFKQIGTNEWFNSEMVRLNENKTNNISACKYYVSILVDQQKRKVGDFVFSENADKIINYDEKLQECLTSTFAAYNSRPIGCSDQFRYFQYKATNVIAKQGSDVSSIDDYVTYYTPTSWFLGEYSYWQNDNDYTPKSPAIMEWNYYSKIGDKLIKKSFGDFKLDSETSEMSTEKLDAYGKILTLTPELPLTKDELSVISTNPINKSGEYVGGGEYVCKKSNAQYINVRTTAEVNEDTGIFDPTDNYINWTSDDVIGKLLKTQYQQPYYSLDTHTLFGNQLTNNDYNKWYQYIINMNPSKLPDFTKRMIERSGDGGYKVKDLFTKSTDYNEVTWDLVMSPNFKDLMPNEIYKKLPASRFGANWYKVEFVTPLNYKGNEMGMSDSMTAGWVRSDNTEMCKKPDDANSQTNYRNELLKRMPMKPLKNGTFSSESKGNRYKEYTQGKFYTQPGKI